MANKGIADISIALNGAPHSLPAGSNLRYLVDTLNLGQQAIAVAVNRQVIARARWNEYALQAADCVDVVRAIGGG